MDGEALADAWERGGLASIDHEQHVRIAAVLVLRHGAAVAEARLVDGTRRACAAAGTPDRFDEQLTRRWAGAVADALFATGAEHADALLAARPELLRSDLLGQPAWRCGTAT